MTEKNHLKKVKAPDVSLRLPGETSDVTSSLFDTTIRSRIIARAPLDAPKVVHANFKPCAVSKSDQRMARAMKELEQAGEGVEGSSRSCSRASPSCRRRRRTRTSLRR